MRRRLALTAAATMVMVTVAFVVPLAVLVRNVAADRAINRAQLQAESLVPFVAGGDADQVDAAVNSIASGDDTISVFLADGTVVGAPADADAAVKVSQEQTRTFTAATSGGKAVLRAVVGPNGTQVVRVFVPSSQLHRGVAGSWLLLGGLGVLLIVLGTVVADRLGRAVVGPMGDLADAARDLGHGRLDTRVEPSGPPEVVEVGRALNVLAARIAVLLAEEREGVADLSHRLRTPLAALRLEAEAVEDEQERLQLQAAVDDVTRAVDQLIDEARRPLREGIGSKADVAGIARDRLAFWAPLAEEEGRRFRLEAPDRAVVVAGHPDDIAAAIDALVGNVLAHTPEGTAFSVAVEPSADGARLVVADEGPGIGDPALLERGVSGAGSSGLGLDIVRRTAEAGGGSFRVGTADGGGAEVSVDLRSPPPG